MMAQVLPVARHHLREAAETRGPDKFGGAHALRQLASDLRRADGVPHDLERHLLGFSLPTVARRTVDASRFAELAGRSEAAAALECQARLWGSALSWAARQQWGWTADAIEKLALLEEEITATL